jgi:hypothetical protein
VPNSYIVVFKTSVTDVDRKFDDLRNRRGITSKFRYEHALKGFAANLTPSDVDALRYDRSIAYIQQNGIMHASVIQGNPPSWGLDRIDEHALPMDDAYAYNQTGYGVDAYIIDTGIRITH